MWQEKIKKQFTHKINKDEIILKVCPYCQNNHYNFQISISKAIFNCWACTAKGRIEKFFRDQHMPFDKTSWQSSNKIETKVKSETLDFSKFIPIDYANYGKFLASRGIEKEDIYKYGLLTTHYGKYKGKIILPLKEGNLVVYFVARDVFKGGRYYNPVIDRSSLLPYYLGTENKLCLYLVEGVFDAIVVNKLGFSSSPLLGNGISKGQIEKIKKFGFKEVVVLLDGDIKKVAIELYTKIKKAGINCKIILISGKEDPNELFMLDREYLRKLLLNSKEVTLRDKVEIALNK